MFLEDAGFDWKVLGPDVSDIDYVAWQADQDAYACSGQKCSAQSLMVMHTNWRKVGGKGCTTSAVCSHMGRSCMYTWCRSMPLLAMAAGCSAITAL